jgi:potassium-transporting ATPase KdpC subunit
MKTLIVALRTILVMTVLTGLIYPLLITGVGYLFFRHKAEGSIVEAAGKPVGSELIGQSFSDPRYFGGRPSATNYDPFPSGGSNLGPTSSDLRDSIVARRARSSPADSVAIPEDLLCASASGLDPDISPEAARYQVDRIIRARQLDPAQRTVLLSLVDRCTEGLTFGVLGQPRVNVLKLNMSLDSLEKVPHQ